MREQSMRKKNVKGFDYALIIIGVLCIAYFIVLLMNMSFTRFLLIYPLVALFCFIYAGIELASKQSNAYRLPRFLRYVFFVFLLAFFSFFIVAEGLIIHQGKQKPVEKSDYVIILGAQINDNTISTSLKYRLDAALEIHERYPDMVFVVSGGKGNDERASEARFMESYLLEHHVKEEQIILEERSTNTYENLLYSKQLLDLYSDSQEYNVTIISNAFHTYRSKYLAEKVGLNANTYAAKMHEISIPNYYLREFFALMKDLVVNLRR
ncbi:MAG: YdcF family protein [Erysipelotrichia bacterium]|nr:YdcF family protein [Erysipelotrichia bacterium]